MLVRYKMEGLSVNVTDVTDVIGNPTQFSMCIYEWNLW